MGSSLPFVSALTAVILRLQAPVIFNPRSTAAAVSFYDSSFQHLYLLTDSVVQISRTNAAHHCHKERWPWPAVQYAHELFMNMTFTVDML